MSSAAPSPASRTRRAGGSGGGPCAANLHLPVKVSPVHLLHSSPSPAAFPSPARCSGGLGVGVDHATIHRDLSDGANAPKQKKTSIQDKELEIESVANAPPTRPNPLTAANGTEAARTVERDDLVQFGTRSEIPLPRPCGLQPRAGSSCCFSRYSSNVDWGMMACSRQRRASMRV